MTDTKILQALADRQTITELIYRYSRAMDRIDAELGYSIWHEDAVVDYGDYYRGSARGFIDRVCQEHLHALYHSHQMSNITIELDGDHAGSETYQTTNMRFMLDGHVKQITVWGRYIDQWSRRDGRWAIDKRISVRDFDEIREVVPMSGLETEGSRDHNDPSYHVLRRQP